MTFRDSIYSPARDMTRRLSLIRFLGTLHLCTRSLKASFLIAALASAILFISPVSAKTGCNKRVTVYSASWCSTCRILRGYLDRNDIRYTVLNVDRPAVKADMISRFGSLSIPRTVIGRSVVSGLDPTRIKQLCR